MRAALAASLLAAMSVVGAGCGNQQTNGVNHGNNVPEVSTISPPAPSAAAASVVGEIRRAWTAFFDVSTPLPRREQLLVDGARFASVLRRQASARTGPTAATVSSIEVTGSTAQVSYVLTRDDLPVLTPQTGEALHQDGGWKVSAETFCSVLVEQGGEAPRACPEPLRPPSESATATLGTS